MSVKLLREKFGNNSITALAVLLSLNCATSGLRFGLNKKVDTSP
jgi:hypothetical protein